MGLTFPSCLLSQSLDMRNVREWGGGTTASKHFSVIDLKPVSPISFIGNIASILPPSVCLLNFISQLILNLEIMVSYLLASPTSINRIENLTSVVPMTSSNSRLNSRGLKIEMGL